MANTSAPLNKTAFTSMVQAYRNKMLVARGVARTQFPADISSGDTIDFPTVTDVRAQSYTAQTDATIDDYVAASDTLTIDQREVVTYYIDPAQKKQATPEFQSDLAFQAAHQLANRVDQRVISTGVNAATSSLSGYSTPSSSNILNMFTDAGATLTRNNAGPGRKFAMIDPERKALIEQNLVANGFQVGDSTLKNGYVGDYNGFMVLVTNNLPSTQSLTIATQPTDGDTVTLYGVTFTFKTALTPTAGEVLIGASAATAQANLRSAVNGTGTAGTDYVELSVANRRTLQNAQASFAAFAANVGALTGFGKIGGTKTLTAGADGWGTETADMLFGVSGAVSMAMQMSPQLFVRPEPKQVGDNYILHQLHGETVFDRDIPRLVKNNFNV